VFPAVNGFVLAGLECEHSIRLILAVFPAVNGFVLAGLECKHSIRLVLTVPSLL
jgi:hypothetical protein